jgi:hypothetical protein
MTQRYAVEQDSPDGGESTYAECWGARAKCRGRVLSEHQDLRAAVIACSAAAHAGMPDSCTWIWDRLGARYVPRAEIRAVGGRFTKLYPGS